MVLWETMNTKIHRLLVKLLGGSRCLEKNLLHVKDNPLLSPQYKKNAICDYGKVNLSSYVITIQIGFFLILTYNQFL